MMINYKTNENHFRIKNKGVISLYYLHQVISLQLMAQRDLRLNITSMFSAIVCYSIGTFISEIFTPVLILSFVCAGLFFIFSINHKAYSYKLALVTNESRTTRFSVNAFEIEDTEQIVSKINKALTINRFSHTYTVNEMSEASDLKQKHL